MIDGFAFSEVVRKLANLIRVGKVAEIDGASVKVKIGRVVTGWLPIVSTAGDTTGWIPISKDEQVVVFAPYGELTQAFVLRAIHYDNFAAPEEKETVSLKTKSDIKVDGEKKFSASIKEGAEVATGDSKLQMNGKDGLHFSLENSKIGAEKERIFLSMGQDGGLSVSLSNNSISLSNQNANININSDSISISCGNSSLSVSSGGVDLSCGSSSVNVSGGSVSINTGGSSIDVNGGSISLSSGSISTTPPICKCSGGL